MSRERNAEVERKPDTRLARKVACGVIEELGIKSPPVDPFSIAKDRQIIVQSSEAIQGSFHGCLMRSKDTFGILYSTKIPVEGFQRFTVSHELGHFHLVHQHETIFASGERHFSLANFSSYQWYEVEADQFAAELIMPERMFREAMRGLPLGLQAIRELAESFCTSLTSTAIRYAQTAFDPVAVIVSCSGRVEYCFASESLQRLEGVSWGIRKGDPVPSYTETHKLNRREADVAACRSLQGRCHISSWFSDCKVDVEMNEDTIGLGSYGKVLTVLFAEVVPEEDDYM